MDSSKLRDNQIIYAPISIGELADKISILRIKCDLLTGQPRKNATQELYLLIEIFDSLESNLIDSSQLRRLQLVKRELWDVENALRKHEDITLFDQDFIALARSVYRLNDERAKIKRLINEASGSQLIEEKSY